ncbi:hypothetical protein D3C87_1124490 [compost metagenome]
MFIFFELGSQRAGAVSTAEEGNDRPRFVAPARVVVTLTFTMDAVMYAAVYICSHFGLPETVK